MTQEKPDMMIGEQSKSIHVPYFRKEEENCNVRRSSMTSKPVEYKSYRVFGSVVSRRERGSEDEREGRWSRPRDPSANKGTSVPIAREERN